MNFLIIGTLLLRFQIFIHFLCFLLYHEDLEILGIVQSRQAAPRFEYEWYPRSKDLSISQCRTASLPDKMQRDSPGRHSV